MFFPFLRFFLLLSVSFWPLGEDAGRPKQETKKTSLDLPRNPENFQSMRIFLLRRVPEIMIETTSPYRVTGGDGRSLFRGPKMTAARVRASADGIQIGSQNFRNTSLRIESEGGSFKIGTQQYREAVRIWREDHGKISVINEIDLEDYLKGVLPWEANPVWPQEALMAQAVASRTYALFKAIENQKEKFDLSHDVLSQVYRGKSAEKPETTQAVEATRGEVLVYRGKIFPAYFHSTCGGATTHAEYLWNVEPHPALKGVTCNFCRSSKHYFWQGTFSRSEIESKLKKKGFAISGLRSIRAVDLDRGGRARRFEIEHAGGKTRIHANDFRLALDPARFKSTLLLSLDADGENFFFRGRGWGHGVGLCQYGMKELAELGYTYREILEYYYPGTEMISVKRET